jgi:hypothetical protein
MVLVCRFSAADVNQKNREFWARTAEALQTPAAQEALLKFLDRPKVLKCMLRPKSFKQLRKELSFEEKIFGDIKFCASQRVKASGPRRRCQAWN